MPDLNGYEVAPPVLMSLPEIARITGLHRSTIHKMCLAGAGPKWLWIGSKIMVPRPAFHAWLASASPKGAGRRVLQT